MSLAFMFSFGAEMKESVLHPKAENFQSIGKHVLGLN